jgi:hypothetical protein
MSGTATRVPYKTGGESCLKPAKNTKHKHTSNITQNIRTQHSPLRDGPRGLPERPNNAPPRARSTSLKGSHPPQARSASLEGPRLPRAGSASLEAPSRAHLLPHAGTSIQCSNTVEPHHHAPGNHAPALFHQLPRGSPSPPLWGTVRRGRCQLCDTVPPTPVWLMHRALEGGPVAPSNPLLVTPQGQTMTPGRRERHPRRCQPCAAIPVPVAPHHALLQLLRRY